MSKAALNKVKESHAKSLGYDSWDECINDQPNYKVETMMDWIVELYHQEQSKWISVEDRLPRHGRPVLCSNELSIGVCRMFKSNKHTTYFKIEGTNHKMKVSHWQRLPLKEIKLSSRGNVLVDQSDRDDGVNAQSPKEIKKS